ncbi:deoxynucleotide monophosphate kinase family protein [Chromobacterium phragmitis]|uniref:deoxynucleotide monophosphate kinase family protein n=1 Tax=Chromobacterium phragmitis TaxID=2202141 RepID=UPI0038781F79
MQLIGLAGPKKSGKDTIADHLVANHGFVKIGFADKIRLELIEAYGLDWNSFLLEDQAGKDVEITRLALPFCSDEGFILWLLQQSRISGPQPDAAPRSPRWLQQQWGDYRRATAGWDYFICAVRDQIEAAAAPVVVSGLRYAASAPIPTAEADLIRQLGGWVWHIDRPGHEASAEHTTEIALPRHPRDLTIDNDGDVEALLEVVDLTIGALA